MGIYELSEREVMLVSGGLPAVINIKGDISELQDIIVFLQQLPESQILSGLKITLTSPIAESVKTILVVS